MFDVGFGELLLVAVVALLVLGPERLPGAARTAGRLLGKLRRSWTDVRSEIEREMQAEDLKRRMNDAVMQGRHAAEDLDRSTRRHIDDIVDGMSPPGDADEEAPGARRDSQESGRDES